MREIVLTEEQARIVAEATEPVRVLNPAGELVGIIYPQGWLPPSAPSARPGAG